MTTSLIQMANKIMNKLTLMRRKFLNAWVKCGRCNGSGYDPYGGQCDQCGGLGEYDNGR